MSLVGKVGRRRPRARLAMAGVYALLIVGAVTTLYPFLLMVSTGLKGPSDQNDNAVVPKFLGDDAELLGKYLDDKYAQDKPLIASTRIGPPIGERASDAELDRFESFLMGLPPEQWLAGFRPGGTQVTSRLMMRYQAWLRARFRGDLQALNRAYIEENVAFQTVQPPSELLGQRRWTAPRDRKYAEWLEFKRALPVEYRIPLRVDRLWQEFWRAKARGQFALVPAIEPLGAKDFESMVANPRSGAWGEFVATRLPARLVTDNVEARWARVTPGPMPVAAQEARWVRRHAPEIRGEFAGRNFRYVLDYILINGNAVLNTAIFCGLAILTQLLVNPLAAYALSRYPVRASGQILIFLLATMAFPAEVALIPSFLLLKNLGLLNTFAALVLPTAASGYMIFLLKGFFDSLPQELFEAGQLDGAPETTLMMRVALPLSRPVLGYLALTAFMASYGAFIYAFLVAQDQRMWTLMVWIYQLQATAPKAVTMAALALAAVPTLVVFLMAQRVIMRGIVLPGER